MLSKTMNPQLFHQAVLVIDDEPLVLKYTCAVISGLGYTNVYRAANAFDARSLFLSHQFELVISDITLPDADGRQLLCEALESNPSATGILISGFACDETKLPSLLQGKVRALEKPFTADDISSILAETFERTAETTCAH